MNIFSGEAEKHTVGTTLIPHGDTTCDACKQPLLTGEIVHLVTYPGTPWKSEDSEDHEWGSIVWHVECDEGSLAAGNR